MSREQQKTPHVGLSDFAVARTCLDPKANIAAAGSAPRRAWLWQPGWSYPRSLCALPAGAVSCRARPSLAVTLQFLRTWSLPRHP